MATIVEDYSPIYVGDTGKPFAPVIERKDGSPEDLTHATLSMKMVLENDASIIKTCDDTKWTVDDGPGGKAHYAWQASDVDTAGLWLLYITITIGGKPFHADDGDGRPKLLEILDVP